MRIAFTHNLQLDFSEEEAEFDTPQTVEMIVSGIRSLGHEVEPVEVSGPASRLVARLEALNPDLIFNTAEGRIGKYREAFYPGLFEQLQFPFTGSDAYVCAVTLDKQLTKLLLDRHGVRSPGGVVVRDVGEIEAALRTLRFPIILKPNYEGSSKGITQDSVVEDETTLPERLGDLLSRYPAGMLVEEYIVGTDAVVPYLEGVSPATGGVLEPGEYEYLDKSRKYAIYDLELKQEGFGGLDIKIPSTFDAPLKAELMRAGRAVFESLGIRDLGRIDFRVTPSGELFFLEVNALPSLESGASIYRSGRLAGLDSDAAVYEQVIASAARRFGIPVTRSPARRRAALRIALTHNREDPAVPEATGTRGTTDATVEAIRQAVESFGHTALAIEATPELSTILPASQIDFTLNLADGLKGRGRRAQVPALLDLLDLPYVGSDPTALAVALDRGLARRVVRRGSVRTLRFVAMSTGNEALPKGFEFPARVLSMALGERPFRPEEYADDETLRARVRELKNEKITPVLVEEKGEHSRYALALLGERRPRALPVVQAAGAEDAGFRPAKLDEASREVLVKAARAAFRALDCRDVAVVELGLDSSGRALFLDCHPLPRLEPGSALRVAAEAAGMDFRTLVGEILAPGLKRLRDARRALRADNGNGDDSTSAAQ
jgi:D-alanine-D-alanine ligase